MALLSPPNPPKFKAAEQFRLQSLSVMNPVRGGSHQGVDLGEPLWIAQVSTTPLTKAQSGAWIATLNSLRGVMNTLELYDPERPRPLAYPDGADLEASWDWSSTSVTMDSTDSSASATASAVDGGPWGAPQVIAYDRANSRIRTKGFIANADLRAGDYAAWDDGETRRLVQLSADADADSSGYAWLYIEPPPPTSEANLPALITMEKASAEFAITSWSAPYAVGAARAIQLSGVQVLRRASA